MMSHTVLVVDDEQDICELVKDILEDEGYSVVVAINGEEARKAKLEHQPDCILLDIWMPDIDGISLLREWCEHDGELECPVIMMSGHGMVEHAVEATRLGAYDFLEKPLTLGKLLLMIERALDNEQQKKLRQNIKASRVIKEPIGKSEKMQALKANLQKIAKFSNSFVLFTGEVGVGKLFFARYLHLMSDRKKQPFIEVQAASLTKENLIANFLGSERDGIVNLGFFEKAENGTIYIQGVEYLEFEVQSLLSSILSMQEFTRLGGRESIKMTSRILASAEENLREMVTEGKFSESLFYQLHVIPIHIMPLREHLEDVPELLNFYVDYLVEKEGLPYRHFSIAAQNRLRNYQWPGNVSELKNLVKRLLILDNKKEIALSEIDNILQEQEQQKSANFQGNIPLELSLRDARELFEKAYLLAQFQECEGNIAKLAEKSGMERTNLYRKLKTLGIDPKKMSNEDQ